MTHSTPCKALVFGCALVLVGCVSRAEPQKQRFMLRAQRPVDVAAGVEGVSAVPGGVLRIDRVRVSTLFERKGFVYRTGEARYENDFYNEFFASPGVMVREAVGGWLAEGPLFEGVQGAGSSTPPDWLLEARVNELYADLRDRGAPAAVLEIEFSLLDARSTLLDQRFRRQYARRVPVPERAAPAIVRAWNEALAEIIAELESDLRRTLRSRETAS